MRFSFFYIIIVLFWVVSDLPLYGQLQKTERFEPSEFWGERVFYSATQASDLTIYFHTSNGILSYDGDDFQELKLQIPKSQIRQILIFENTLLIATNETILQYFPQKDSITTLTNKKALQLKSINSLLWILTSSELLLWQNGALNTVFESEKGEVFQSFSLNGNTTIIGHSNGITLLEKDGSKKRFASYLNPDKMISSDSSTYILSNDAIFSLIATKVVRNYKHTTKIIDFHIDDFGEIWFLENGNVLKLYDKTESSSVFYSDENEPITGTSLFSDMENNLWVLGNNTLFKVSPNNPFTLLHTKGVQSVYTEKYSKIIIQHNKIIYYEDVEGSTSFKLPNSVIPLKNNFAFYDNDEWIITLNQQIYKFNKTRNKLMLAKAVSKFTPIKKISDTDYLAKGPSNLLYITNDNFEPIEKVPNIKPITKLAFANQKIFALAQDNSIIKINSKGDVTNEIKLNDSIKIENVVPATDGFWYYTSWALYKIKQSKPIEKLKINQYLNYNQSSILNIFDDGDENLWVCTKSKLLRFPIVDKNGKTLLQKPTEYNETDFLFSTYFKTAKKDSLGTLWFIHEKGISIYNPLKEIPNLTPPSIKIKTAFAYQYNDFGNPIDTVFLNEEAQTLSADATVIIIPKVVNHFRSFKSRVGYRNLTSNQSERIVNSGEKIIVRDLGYGLNTIQLKGYNHDDIESENEVTISVFVPLPFWKKNWFYIVSFLGLVSLCYMLYKIAFNIKSSKVNELKEELQKGLSDLEKKSHLQLLKAERLKQLNDLITSQKRELEKKNQQIESQKYELSLTNKQIKKQKDLLQETSSKLTSSIDYAKRIQKALMGTEVEIKKAFPESFVYFLPRDAVSGDFYWFDKVQNEKGEELLILAAVDCTGHGVPGAIVSVVGMNLLNNITKLKHIYDPGAILTELNNDILRDLRQNETQVNDGMDMSIITYNTSTKHLYFAGAKNPLIYVEENELLRIKGDKYAIGGQQKEGQRTFTTHKFQLNDGKERSFYLFSDGYQDQFGGEKGFKYLAGNFKKLLHSIHKKDILEQKAIIHDELENWRGDYDQTDDILVIGFKI